MKNRPMTYLLLALVVVIWAVVIRRVVSRAAPAEGETATETVRTLPEPEREERPLALDYRDPFLEEVQTVRPRQESVSSAPLPAGPEPDPIPPPLRFQGIIRQEGAVYALLEHGGVSSLLQRNDTLEQVRILSIADDSVVVEQGKHRFTLRLE